MATTYGYARCSTDETRQDVDRQKRELLEMGVIEEKYIYWEYESGIKTDRIELSKLFDIVNPGDTIAATEVSRLTRSTQQLCDILKTIQEKKLCLRIGALTVDCRAEQFDPMTKGMLLMWGVFSEMERDMISQRVKSGMKNAADKGKTIGRPKTTADTLPDKFWRYRQLYNEKKISVTDFARMMKCSRTTIYKYLEMTTDGTSNKGTNS